MFSRLNGFFVKNLRDVPRSLLGAPGGIKLGKKPGIISDYHAIRGVEVSGSLTDLSLRAAKT